MNINEFYKFLIKELRNISNKKSHYNCKNVYFLRFHRISDTFLYRPYYDNQRAWQRISGYQATATAIQNPFTIYYMKDKDWSDTHSYQFWNKNFTDDPGITNASTLKTIYSPSPSGYMEPKAAAFTSFTSTGDNTGNQNQFNITGGFNKGWSFYTNGWKTGDVFFIPCIGYRSHGNGEIIDAYTSSDFWTNAAKSTSQGRSLGINRLAAIHPQSYESRAYALPIIMVKE